MIWIFTRIRRQIIIRRSFRFFQFSGGLGNGKMPSRGTGLITEGMLVYFMQRFDFYENLIFESCKITISWMIFLFSPNHWCFKRYWWMCTFKPTWITVSASITLMWSPCFVLDSHFYTKIQWFAFFFYISKVLVLFSELLMWIHNK